MHFRQHIKEIIREEGLQGLSSDGDDKMWKAEKELSSGTIDIKEAIERFFNLRDGVYEKALKEKYGHKLDEYLEKKLEK